MTKNFKWLLLVALTFVACNTDEEGVTEVPVSPGSADFSKYVALGDSFAAGYSDNALFPKGQENAYPNIIAQQLAAAGGGAFTSPWMSSDNIGGFSLGGNQVVSTRLFFNGSGPVNVPGVTSTLLTDHISGTVNNMGIPGAKSYHLVYSGYAGLNPYFGRIASAPTATVLADAVAQSPSFFSLWIGGNDVLGYATSGGVGVNQTGNLNPATYGNGDITDPNVFASVFNTLVNNLTANGAKGVVANLPYVNTLPYFTTVPYNPLTAKVLGSGNEATGQATITALNAQLYGPLHNALAFLGQGSRIQLLSSTGGNPMLIKDETLTNLSTSLTAVLVGGGVPQATAGAFGAIFGQVRQTTATDLVLLPTQSVLGTAPTAANSGIGVAPSAPLNKFGITFPLQDKDVLIPSEIAAVATATDAYNATIQSVADTKGLAFVDAKATMNSLLNGGINFDGYNMTTTYVTGNSFSLDGVHPGARGYALIANRFIEAINAKYGSTLKNVKAANYQILYPASF
jgi:lysophospholipase L1-like esterase